jgi:two-component system, LytTR family, sensor kinase
MDILIHTTEQACVLVTLTFILAQTGSFARPRRQIGPREQVAAILLFLVMAFAEEFLAQRHRPMNARIIASCAAGLLAGPTAGAAVGLGSALIAYALRFAPPAGFGLAMLAGGVAGGFVALRRAAWVDRPVTGLLLGSSASLLRYAAASGLSALFRFDRPPLSLAMEAQTALINGVGVALVLQVVAQVRARENSARAAARAEVRSLQARMNPHFLFNALNTIAALSAIDPRAVPRATSRLARFLRGSLEQHDRVTVSLREEMEIVSAYLDVESLRMGDRLKVESCIESGVLEAPVPPFLVQPLVENAVKHGIQPSDGGGRVRLEAWAVGRWLMITVADTGVGFAPARALRSEEGSGDRVHALDLLRLRLAMLYDRSFSLEVRGAPGAGTTASIRIPLDGSGTSSVRRVVWSHDARHHRGGRTARP